MKRYCAVAVAVLITGPVIADNTATGEHIRRVESGIVPPVLVNGETPLLQAIDARMAELHVPGMSVAVIHQGRIEWARGYGVTRAGGPPVTPDTLFQAASISKPVFALAVLHLTEAGKLDLDKNVNDYLKTWKLPDNEFTQPSKVTLRGILSHSAGLTVHGFPGYAAGAPLPSTVQILDGTAPANSAPIRVDSPPGSRWQYSGGGYVLAQQLLNDVTGVPLPTLMRNMVLEPLGMTRSTFEQPLPAARASEVALPHNGEGKPVEGGPHVYPEMAPAGLWTTPSDLARYSLGIEAALKGKSKKVITAATARSMLTPVIGSQGIGPQVGGSTARKYFSHGGANEGYRCLLVAYEDGEGAVVMTNADSGDAIMGEMMRTIAHVYQWPDFAPPTHALISVKPEVLDRYVGGYELNDGSLYVVRKRDDQLVGQNIGRTPLLLFPSSDREFFARDVDVVVNFSVDDKGAATGLRHRLYGQEREGKRMDEASSRKLLASVEKLERRVKDQTPLPGSETAVRQLLAGIASGKPDYDRMSPQFAELTRQQLAGLQNFVTNLGALKSLTFHLVSPEGGDQYDADFEKGALRIDVRLGDDGRIEGAGVLPR